MRISRAIKFFLFTPVAAIAVLPLADLYLRTGNRVALWAAVLAGVIAATVYLYGVYLATKPQLRVVCRSL